VDGPVLLVVGSPARATRDQLERLRQAPDCAEVAIEAGGGTRGHREAVDAVRACLSAGRDCALTLAGEGGARDAGPDGSAALAAVAARAAELAGGLVLTGGETARATLQALAVRSLTLAGEIQPGIALACADCARPLPLAIKAGGFGSPDALLACRRAMRREETVASDTEKGTASAR
jgi:4-hydroxythreonine-4-phosphate dehydrogenase